MMRSKLFLFFSLTGVAVGTSFFLFYGEAQSPLHYVKNEAAVNEITAGKKDVPPPEEPRIYLSTPAAVRAIYMTSWVAGTPSFRNDLVKFIENSEINAVVIDMKDYTGKISFEIDDTLVNDYDSVEKRIPDVKDFIQELNKKNIYVIARIAVFQDPHMVLKRPDLAVKNGTGGVWKDRKGISWIDPAAKEYWDYIVRLAKAAKEIGFDELNFDYIRFPSDGNMQNIKYEHWDKTQKKAEVIRDFFAHLRESLSGIGIPLSADLFGMTTTNADDLNIGQILEYAEPYFDYIAPMVYPSHYPTGFIGLKNPAANPYEVIHYSMSRAADRLTKASSTPNKLRPWIQDFDLGATYDAVMVNKQKQAIYDVGLESWMAWDPSNKYTREAYRK